MQKQGVFEGVLTRLFLVRVTFGELLDLYKMGHKPVNRQESRFPRVIRKVCQFRLRHRELFLTRNAEACRTFCDTLTGLLRPYDAGSMDAYPVSTFVNMPQALMLSRSANSPSACLLLPSSNVHTHHDEPQLHRSRRSERRGRDANRVTSAGRLFRRHSHPPRLIGTAPALPACFT